MTKQRMTSLWSRTAQALGRLWAEMISLPDDRRQPAERAVWTELPRFPPF